MLIAFAPASDTGNKKANPKAGLIIEDFFENDFSN